jgi:hypothetical protein
MQGCSWLLREPTDTSTHHVSTYFSLSSCSFSFTQEVIYYYGKTVSQVPLTIFVNIITVFTFVVLITRCATENDAYAGVVNMCSCFILLIFCVHIVLHFKGFIALIHDSSVQ